MRDLSSNSPVRVSFSELVDLASEIFGAKVIEASDDFFSPKEDLLKAEPAVFIADKYTENGKWMDGWESRRKREKGFDWLTLKLGLAGEIHGVNVDTSFFTGNFPEYVSIEGIEMPSNDSEQDLEGIKWVDLLEKAPVHGGSQNYFAISSRQRVTHLRLNIFPDGGVARLRVHGVVRPSAEQLKGTIDLAAIEKGARVVCASNVYFSPKDNLIVPGTARHMGEGWETQRRRGPGHDWIIVKLAGKARIRKIEVDTHHFKGNFPDTCSVDGLLGAENLLPCDFRDNETLSWLPLVERSQLKAHSKKEFSLTPKTPSEAYNYLRLNIFPDGGVSRLRVLGELVV